MQQLPRGPVGMNGGPGPQMYPSSHHMRLPGPSQGRMPAAQPRLNGQQYGPIMQSQLQRQVSKRWRWFPHRGALWVILSQRILMFVSHLLLFLLYWQK